MIEILKKRFMNNQDRHPGLSWEEVEARLENNGQALAVLERMEESGGEPDCLYKDENTGKIICCDCSKESPAKRRSLCYDEEARFSRKKNPPAGSAMREAEETGVQLMNEEMYRRLQMTGEYDLKTSSWIATPEEIRKLGGALFCERRYNTVFVFHNGADSYYGARGWRGYIEI